MNRTGKRRKRRVKKYLTLLIAVLILAIAGTIGLGIWKKSNRNKFGTSEILKYFCL